MINKLLTALVVLTAIATEAVETTNYPALKESAEKLYAENPSARPTRSTSRLAR